MIYARSIPLLTPIELSTLKPELADPIEYRKSGLSLNHIIGCPLDCAYCVRHLFNNFEMKIPHAIMSDKDAVERLTSHAFFRPNLTPIQIFNRATDPMLEPVRPHLLQTIAELDRRGLTNHVIIITRWRVTEDICRQLNNFCNVKITVLVTHSGIQGPSEPVDSRIALQSLQTLFEHATRYRTILYWRPLIPGLNDTDAHLAIITAAAKHAHAVVFSGLFYRQQIADHYRASGISEPYNETARRKIMPESLEQRILKFFRAASVSTSIFRKTSCGVSFVHQAPDYNGHFGINEICDVCPALQVARCAAARRIPEITTVQTMADKLGATAPVTVTDRAIITDGLDESRRYFIQHALEYQVHDRSKPHHLRRHGRAEIGWGDDNLNPPIGD